MSIFEDTNVTSDDASIFEMAPPIPSGITVPDLDLDGDTFAAAIAYAAAGMYLLPIRPGSKKPGSLVGDGWQHQSTRDTKTLAAHLAGTSNGIALHVGRSGLIVFDVDHPAHLPAELARAIDEMHPPFHQSRPNEVGRGHYVLAVPPGRRYGNGTGQLGKAWGEVRGENGIIVLAPSLHEDAESGAAYRWASTGPVPVVPDYLDAMLPAFTESAGAATDAVVEAFLTAHTGATRLDLFGVWTTLFGKDVEAGGSRHDSMLSKTAGAMREARAGYYPARHAADRLREVFVAAVTDPNRPGQRPAGEAESEWSGILAWAIAQAEAANLDEVHRRVAQHAPLNLNDFTTAPGSTPPPGVDPETGEMPDESPPPTRANLPAEFYAERPELAHIQQAARCRGRSADAVLGVVLARLAAITPPTVRLPAPIGTEATLDLMVAIIGMAGAGKSSSAKVSAELLPVNDDGVAVVPLGSGEGLIEAYFDFVDEVGEDDKTRKVKRQVRRGVLAMLDEGQALAEMGSRKGTTLLPTIRSAWTGDRLGQANASEERKRQIPPGEYRFALVAGFQTEYATALLDDAAGGTPQRFLFLAAEDASLTDEAVAWPGELTYKQRVHQAGPMGLDAEVSTEIRRRGLARSRGEAKISPLDSHRDLSRLKVAGLLALLADRMDITADDWRLAGMVLDSSDRVRGSIQLAAMRRAADSERATLAKLNNREAVMGAGKEERALQGLARGIARHVHRAKCEKPCRRRCVQIASKTDYLKLASLDEAIDLAQEHGWIDIDGDVLKPGKVKP